MTEEQLKRLLVNEHGRLHKLLFPDAIKPAEVKVRIITEVEINQRIPNLVSAYRDGEDSITNAMTDMETRNVA